MGPVCDFQRPVFDGGRGRGALPRRPGAVVLHARPHAMGRRWKSLGVVVAAAVAAWAWASVDRCGEWPLRSPVLRLVARGQGPVLVGAAKEPLRPEFPVTVGGYGPVRSTATRAALPLSARALVLSVGGEALALVALDVLLVPPQLRDRIAQGAGLRTWVVATHTHSSVGGYDPRAASELAALGAYSPGDEALVARAAVAAVQRARAGLQPVKLELGEGSAEGFAVPRTGAAVDARLTRLRFDGATGPVAQLVVLSGHPTLAPMRTEALHPDWPGALAEAVEAEAGPVTLVLQGAGGNASVARARYATPEAAAGAAQALLRDTPTQAAAPELPLALAEVAVSLPRPDATRVVPPGLRAAAENALCDDAEDVATLGALRLGPVALLFLPLEPSLEAGRVLAEQARVARVVSLANGYAGYVEPEAVALAGAGEARRQYFPPALLERLAEGARLAGDAVAGR